MIFFIISIIFLEFLPSILSIIFVKFICGGFNNPPTILELAIMILIIVWQVLYIIIPMYYVIPLIEKGFNYLNR